MKQLFVPFALCIAFLFAGSFDLSAQGKQPKPKRERVKQLKIAYFTEQLDLSTEQAEKFWPIYNEMTEKIKTKKKEARIAAESLKNDAGTLTDDEFKTKAQTALDATIEEAKLKKEYHEKIAAVIGYKKAAKLLSLEAQFKRELLKRLAEEGPKAPNKNE